jgi:hypothetical protein
MIRDGAATAFNRLSAAVELAMAAAVGAPWLVWLMGGSP